MTAASTLPFDFVEYLCLERHIEHDAALELLAAEVQELSRTIPITQGAYTTASASNPRLPKE